MERIPSYELYGDFLAGTQSDALHYETIEERSSRHDWTIRLHRHRRLGQVFLFRTSGVFFRLGDVEYESTEPLILVIPPEIPHGFLFAEDVTGDVLTLRLDELPSQFGAQFAALAAETDMIFPKSETRNFEDTATLIAQLGQSFHSIHVGRSEILTTQAHLILLYLMNNRNSAYALGAPRVSGVRGKQDRQVEAFCALLEAHYQDAWLVADYAKHLGISAPHLTRLCRDNLAAPPNALVRQRRLLEAKRLLEYTGLTVAEIAHRCGFRDAAFFSRTFKSTTGLTAQSFRKKQVQRTFVK